MKKIIFATILFSLSLTVFAQYDSTKLLQDQNAYGFRWKNGKFRYQLTIPTDTVTMAVADSGSLAYKGGSQYFWNGYYWIKNASGTITTDWSTTGNASTTAGTNFIGTTDNVDFEMRRNNLAGAWLDYNPTISMTELNANSVSSIYAYHQALTITSGVSPSTNYTTFDPSSLSTARSLRIPDSSGTIALLQNIPSYTVPTLQQVTDAGHETTNDLTLTSPYPSRNSITWTSDAGTNYGQLTYAGNTGNNLWTLPNASGVVPISVNGNTANAAGAITITSGAGSGTVTGSGTTNYIPKWSSSTALGNSLLTDDATNVTNSGTSFITPRVYGSTAASGDLLIDGTSSATKTTSYVSLQEAGGYVQINTGSSANYLAIPIHIGNSTTIRSVNAQIMLNPTISNSSGSGNSHMFAANEYFIRDNASANAFDVRTDIGGGAVGQGHYAGFQFAPSYDNAGQHIQQLYGFYSKAGNTNGTIDTLFDAYIAEPTAATGTLSNHYGIYIEPLTYGTNKYAIYTAGSTANYFGGAVTLGSTINKLTLTQPATAATLTIANNKTFTVNNTLSLTGTDATTMTFPTTSATIARTDAANTFTGTQTLLGQMIIGSTGTAGKISLNRSSDGLTLGSIEQKSSYLTIDGSNGIELQQGGFSGTRFSSTGLFVSSPSIGASTATSTLQSGGSFATAYRAITALRTLDATDHTINCTSGTYTVTLPTAASITGRQYVIVNSGSGTITIGTTSSQTFANINATPTTLTLAPGGAGAIVSYTVVSNGANWIVTAKVKDE